MRRVLVALVLAGCSHPSAPTTPPPDDGARVDLTLADGWALQSSARVAAAGEALSRPGFDASGWHAASVPTTVVAALVADGTYPDPYYDLALRSLPGGTDYDIGQIFSYFPMSPANPSSVPWWYRTEFALPAAPGRHVWLAVDGVNYRAAVWLNGRRVADESEVAGTFRSFEWEVTGAVSTNNALALAVTAPEVANLAYNWVDWAPFPPDKNQGVWQPVRVVSTGAVRLRAPHVMTTLDLPSLDVAHVQITVEAENADDAPVALHLDGVVGASGAPPVLVAGDATLAAHETRVVRLPPFDLPQPLLWWPSGLGPQNLYELVLSGAVGGRVSDSLKVRFGVRQTTSELTEEGYRLFRVNGHPVLVRGGGWSPDLLLRQNAARVDDELAYVKDMHLNAIRLEGKLGDDHLLDRADELGILVIAGWCCCDHWEQADSPWTDEDVQIALGSLNDQIKRLRNHPSVLAWLHGSDNAPGPDVEQQYADAMTALDWDLPALASANSSVTPVYGSSGVKMPGPYHWVPPSYWYLDDEHGGAFGFNTETSMGAAIPPVESLGKFLSMDHLWPSNQTWALHTGGTTRTQDLSEFDMALAARYGAVSDLDDYDRKAQLAAYEGVRAMFEAYGHNKYHSTGVIQWMLNNPWPGMIWHLYDWYLKPAGGYFAAKKALEPLHVQYGYDDGDVSVVNSTAQAYAGLGVRA